jgi:RNA polymerase sigma-70 factor (ECF subfamily)
VEWRWAEVGNKPALSGYDPDSQFRVDMRDDINARQAAWSRFETEALPHAGTLFRMAMWFERNRDEAEDLVQDTLKQALESFHRYTPGTNCRAWLMSILQHARSNKRRARGRSPIVPDTDDAIASTVPFVPPVPEQLTDEELLGALRRIPQQYQEVIVLSDVEELPYKEIAKALSIPMGTVMSRLHRGRALLREELTAGKSRLVPFSTQPQRSRG